MERLYVEITKDLVKINHVVADVLKIGLFFGEPFFTPTLNFV